MHINWPINILSYIDNGHNFPVMVITLNWYNVIYLLEDEYTCTLPIIFQDVPHHPYVYNYWYVILYKFLFYLPVQDSSEFVL